MERFDAIYEDGVLIPAEPLPLPDHTEVEIIVVSKVAANGVTAEPPSEGFRASAGAWSDEAESLDDYLAKSREARRADRLESEP